MSEYIKWFNEISLNDISLVGGKNASLGEMVSNISKLGIDVPYGFAITTKVYDKFIEDNNLETYINEQLNKLKHNYSLTNLKRIGMNIRNKILASNFNKEIEHIITTSYLSLSKKYTDIEGIQQNNTDVAIRSSGTLEDMPDASFAGQQETYLNVRNINDVLNCVIRCFSSLYTDRAISYRITKNFVENIKISVGVQKMVRSDLGSAGVAFSIDSDSGFNNVILINGSFGLGELVVSGKIKPDEVLVFKPKLNDKQLIPIIEKKLGQKHIKMIYGTNPGERVEIISLGKSYQNKMCINDEHILLLSNWIVTLEKYYTNLYKKWCPLDVEWAIDGLTNKLYIVQARPETVYSKTNKNIINEYSMKNNNSKILLEGVAVGNKISSGCVKKMYNIDNRDCLEGENNIFKQGDILVTDMTDPDWEPIMKISSGIITNRGGRTCHASIVARELGIPAIVGTLNGTDILDNNQEITLSCADGETGKIYEGIIPYEKTEIDINKLPKIKTKLLLNLASPDKTFLYHSYPVQGVGLVREEFIFTNYIKVHPMALLKHKELNDTNLTKQINELCKGFDNEIDYFIKKLSYGLAKIAATFYPKEVIVRFSDFKSNEYYNLLGGKYFEPSEQNPMIGWRGASRYYSDNFKEAFGLECKAIKYLREVIGLDNVVVMIPFCRTVNECINVQTVMANNGLKRGENGLKIFLMCEIPSNVILANEFSKYIDGYSIGSNDLTQLILGLDRDSELVQHIYDERNDAVKLTIKNVIESCKKNNIKIGICGQGPSDYPEFASFLVENGIDSISITPDSLIKTINVIHDVEQLFEKKLCKNPRG